MKLLTVVASSAIALAFVASASAQRGGASRGGFSGHSAPSFHSSFAPSAHYSSGPAYRYSGPSFAAPRLTSAPAAHSNFYSLHRPPITDRRRYAPRIGVAVPYPGIYSGYGDYGYIDPGYTDAAPYDDASTQPIYPDPGPQPEVEQQQAASAPPPPVSNQRRARPPQPAPPQPAPPQQEDAVTLIFKDGRPSEQIHNYMLTRTMLYVRDQQRRDIPVDQLDLVATKKANRANGVEFALPTGN